MNSLKTDARLRSLLDRLHAQSEAQTPEIVAFFEQGGGGSVGGNEDEVQAGRRFWRDKLVALDPTKAAFCYALCRAMNARHVVECGTSFGVSTLYLAAALRDNGGGLVTATEYEAEKASAAHANWEEAGLSAFIDLREGDLRQTLKSVEGPVDFLLMDIWTPMARPALELVAPQMRLGAIAIADNTVMFHRAYADYFAYLNEPANGFTTATLPFEGGLELSVKTG